MDFAVHGRNGQAGVNRCQISDATVLPRSGFFYIFFYLMHVFHSNVLSLTCEAVLCLELVFAELGQAHYKYNLLLLLLIQLD